jgi:hypothetical protein
MPYRFPALAGCANCALFCSNVSNDTLVYTPGSPATAIAFARQIAMRSFFEAVNMKEAGYEAATPEPAIAALSWAIVGLPPRVTRTVGLF